MASEIESLPQHCAAVEPWPPDDTEESVVGTDLHQKTIVNLRWGLNEIARMHTAAGQAVPWQALSQTIVNGFERPNGTRYRTLPDVFVYRKPIDQNRGSVALVTDGPPTLIIEVLSESTYEVDLDLQQGKGYSYARAGVQEYLALDPTGKIAPAGGSAWHLRDGVYQPWERDSAGRWRSEQIDVMIGLEGALATVYTLDGKRQLHEGEVTELARREAELTAALERREAELAELRRRLDELQQNHH